MCAEFEEKLVENISSKNLGKEAVCNFFYRG
jgi:hypothetical protein